MYSISISYFASLSNAPDSCNVRAYLFWESFTIVKSCGNCECCCKMNNASCNGSISFHFEFEIIEKSFFLCNSICYFWIDISKDFQRHMYILVLDLHEISIIHCQILVNITNTFHIKFSFIFLWKRIAFLICGYGNFHLSNDLFYKILGYHLHLRLSYEDYCCKY